MSWEQQLGTIAIMLVTSKGAAAVSGGSFVVFAATVTAIGVFPVEGLALLFGVYRFMSMAIATCNTIGNRMATVVVSKWSGEFTEQPAGLNTTDCLAAAQRQRSSRSSVPSSYTEDCL